jgi:hypothetical protein
LLTRPPLPSATTNAAYVDQQLYAVGGTPPYSWSLATGSNLPPGFSLSTAGLLTGTGTASSSTPYSFSVEVTDNTSHTSTFAFGLTVVPNAGTITSPSSLHVNLSYMPFSHYNNTDLASAFGLLQVCPSTSSTVQGCFQATLASLKAQHASGVRIFTTFCDEAGYSLALLSCNTGTLQTWNANTYPGMTWIQGVNAFFTDVANAGIQDVSITFVHASGGNGTLTLPKADTSSPSGAYCGDTPDPVYFWPTEPFGLAANGYPLGYGGPANYGNGYNCAAINPYFIGWQSQFDVADAMLGAAQGKVTISELEFEQELNMVQFTAYLRFIYDNAQAQTAGTKYTTGSFAACYTPGPILDEPCVLRQLMTNHSFDPGRVT